MELSQGKALCAQFGLGRLRALGIAGGTRNANFLLTTDTGTWFARQRHPAYSEAERIRFDHAVERYMAERGVPVQQPRPTLAGAPWWDDNGTVWEVFPFVEGRHLRDGNAEDVAALGAAVGQWHQAGRDFPLRYEKAAPRGETDPERLMQRAETLAQESAETAEALVPYRQALERAARELPPERYAALPHTLIHGDIQPANVLMREGRVAAFVDLDWCAWQARLYDLCFVILVCCASHATPIDGGDIRSLTQTPFLNADVTAAFLRAYQDAAAPLTAEERAALRPQLALSWCHVRVDGAYKVPADERAAFLHRPPDPATSDWLALPL
jgi:homoserine kinase type II